MFNFNKKRNNETKFDSKDIFLIFYLIGKLNPPISRAKLLSQYEIGEGSLKNILNILEKQKLIIKNKKGNSLTNKGQKLYNKIQDHIQDFIQIPQNIFNDNLTSYGLILKKYDNEKFKHIYFGRDYAIREGCFSAMILECRKNIKIPQTRNYNYNFLKETFHPQKTDLIIVASANNIRTIYKGILATTKYLNQDLNKIINTFKNTSK